MEFCRTEQLDNGSWTVDDEQTVKLKADFVISAFGSQLGESDGKHFSVSMCVGSNVIPIIICAFMLYMRFTQ